MWCVYFLACVLLPICVPVPETAVVLWGTRQIGSLGAFFFGVTGSVLGLMFMYSLSSLIAHHILKGRKEIRQLAWFMQLTGRYRVWILGVLLIVPLVSDEVLFFELNRRHSCCFFENIIAPVSENWYNC